MSCNLLQILYTFGKSSAIGTHFRIKISISSSSEHMVDLKLRNSYKKVACISQSFVEPIYHCVALYFVRISLSEFFLPIKTFQYANATQRLHKTKCIYLKPEFHSLCIVKTHILFRQYPLYMFTKNVLCFSQQDDIGINKFLILIGLNQIENCQSY